MVKEYQSSVRVYKYPFELVMAAYEMRFPTCPLIPVFLGSDVLSETTSPDGSIRVTERRCKIHVDVPFILKKIAGTDHLFFHQKNTLDLKKRTLNIEAENESFATRFKVIEKCRYYVHSENVDWTCYEQYASLQIISFFGFESVIEKIAMKQYSQNIATGKEVIEHFISQLKDEDKTFVPMWKSLEKEYETATNGKLPNNCVEEVSAKLNDMSVTSPAGRRHSSSPPLSPHECTLEADYIVRYLGDLTPIQESTLVQLKRHFASFGHSQDTTLLRFLRAYDFNLEKSIDAISESLVWRKCNKVDAIIQEYKPSDIIKQYYPGGWHQFDKDSSPLYVLRVGQTDWKGLLKSVGWKELLKLIMHVCEEGLKLTVEATEVSGKPVTTWSLLIDLEGLNMRHFWRPGVKALLKIIEIVEKNYPETLGRVFVVRTPSVFPIMWKIIGAFIDEKTRSKFQLYGGNDYLQEGGLLACINEKILPDFLGGTCETTIPAGGLVPRELYIPDIDMENDLTFGEANTYDTVVVECGRPYEIAAKVVAGSVVAWDFDTLCQDVAFTMLHIKEDINIQPYEIFKRDADRNKSLIEQSWVEGKEYEVVELMTISYDGNNVQGSYIAPQDGTYVLRWSYDSTSPNHELLGQCHKANILVYFEIIKSVPTQYKHTHIYPSTLDAYLMKICEGMFQKLGLLSIQGCYENIEKQPCVFGQKDIILSRGQHYLCIISSENTEKQTFKKNASLQCKLRRKIRMRTILRTLCAWTLGAVTKNNPVAYDLE